MRKTRTFIILGVILIGGILSALLVIPGTKFSKPFQLGLDLQGGIHLVYQADLSQIAPEDKDSAIQGLRDVIERRVNLFGVKEPRIQTQGKGEKRKLIVELAGIKDANTAIQLIGQTPYLEFREPKENFEEILEKNRKAQETGEETPEDPFKPTQLTGRFLKRADIGFDPVTNKPLVTLQFNSEGAKLFEEITERNVGKPLAIYLDYQLIEAPIVQSKISGGNAQITGQFTIKEVQRIVRDLNAGALPVPITLISQQNVGATLGTASVKDSIKAGAFGFIGVMLFMIIFYRFLGVLASFALLLYVLFLLALFKLIPVTLTLAGIAGFILSIGMAVDANVLIFSRLREELKEKKSFSLAVQEGFRRAWPSIRDGNITTLLVAIVLFWFGSSFVQGFALTLSIGILMSMFTAIFVTRNLLDIFVGTRIGYLKWLW